MLVAIFSWFRICLCRLSSEICLAGSQLALLHVCLLRKKRIWEIIAPCQHWLVLQQAPETATREILNQEGADSALCKIQVQVQDSSVQDAPLGVLQRIFWLFWQEMQKSNLNSTDAKLAPKKLAPDLPSCWSVWKRHSCPNKFLVMQCQVYPCIFMSKGKDSFDI